MTDPQPAGGRPGSMMKKWIADIKEKTKDMDRSQTIEYICNYSWYHILLGLILLGLVLLLTYHIGWGDQKKDFTCVIVNQEIDFSRDREIREGFSEFSGLDQKKINIDSDYQISYTGKELEGVNESSYEKFFFNWSAGETDAMIIPESFYEYCLLQNGEFAEDRIYIKDTWLKDILRDSSDDPVLLVFAEETKHRENCISFMEFVKGR